jgi:hypothetical protein
MPERWLVGSHSQSAHKKEKFLLPGINPGTPVSQYSETSVMHFIFSLLRINGLYMFRALLDHP